MIMYMRIRSQGLVSVRSMLIHLETMTCLVMTDSICGISDTFKIFMSWSCPRVVINIGSDASSVQD